ncbi:ABC transporter permease [Paenibacillus doosanensis]|uniref:FtsX-like permease family protein n=1 Tax=Paenibacillus doosanensis TaxID=1229154 RepID=UPI00217F6CE2|nr:ABC transporter permease [Paenibacillus doosanensis]MCS7459874.1 ABC transporter permease [Paenibacillus doosanensis]
MTFRQLALKNIQGNWHRYIAFFLSSTFSVMIFYIYASFIFHPDVVNGAIQAADKVRHGMIACEFLIVMFSFFFVLYASFAFLKTRKKEIGLLTLLGMTRSQINKLVLYENAAIALLSIAAGCTLGTLFSKLFFMALAELLQVDNPIRFLIVPQALLYTAAGFFLLFLAITLITLIGMGRNQVIELLKASKQPKTMPASSGWLAALAVVCLGTGYGIAYTTSANMIVLVMLPVTGLVVVGTYFLFTQASVAILKRLQRMPGFYYRSTRLITIAQLVFKMKDNARILFVVSVLSAVILTASGSVYMFYQGAREQLLDTFPQSIGYAEPGSAVTPSMRPEQVQRSLAESGVQVTGSIETVGIVASAELNTPGPRMSKVLLLPADVYNEAVEPAKGAGRIAIEPGHGLFVNPYRGTEFVYFKKGDILTTAEGEPGAGLQMDGQISGAFLNLPYETNRVVLMNDGDFQALLTAMPEEKKLAYAGYEIAPWEQSGAAVNELKSRLTKAQADRFSDRVSSYLEMKQFSSLTLFIGVFISFLFFMASGSMLYFKLFTELQDDQAQYRSLTRIGVSMQEIRSITSAQIGIIFFIPVLVGGVHAAFAYKALSNTMAFSVWKYGLLIVLIYAVMQLFYFLLTRRAYMKQMKRL